MDTVWQTFQLPPEKLDDLRNRVTSLLSRKKVTLWELQELVGHLNFACKAIAPGQAFLWRLCAAIQGLQRPFHRMRITVAIREDLEVWRQFLERYNGVSFCRSLRLLKAEFHVQSDVAGSAGFGIYYRGKWCAGTWPDEWHKAGVTRDLTFLDFFPIVGALWLWAEE